MPECISDYEFKLCVDPYDNVRAQIRDMSGQMVATVNRLAMRPDEGLAIARLLCAAPAMLRALEAALDAYSPKTHLLGIACSGQQRQAAMQIRDALRAALYGPMVSEPACSKALACEFTYSTACEGHSAVHDVAGAA
jgi:hypothetical protein